MASLKIKEPPVSVARLAALNSASMVEMVSLSHNTISLAWSPVVTNKNAHLSRLQRYGDEGTMFISTKLKLFPLL